MGLVFFGFQGGGEWSGSEIERAVTRHPRTLVVHVSCAHRLRRRCGTHLLGTGPWVCGQVGGLAWGDCSEDGSGCFGVSGWRGGAWF